MVQTAVQSNGTSSHTTTSMTLEQARQVLWVRPERRPLGELLDEGIVTPSRLEWAVNNAYAADLRQAAQVVLDALNKAQEAAPPKSPDASDKAALDRARSTIWPFNEFRDRPMGELLDLGLLNIKSLGYAVENAHDPRVRNAARILILHHLDQPAAETPDKGVVKIVSGGRSFMLRKQFELFLYMGTIGGLVLGAALIFGLWSFVTTLQARASAPTMEYPPLAIVVALALTILLAALAFFIPRLIMGHIFNAFMVRINRYRRGQEGEDRVIETLLPALDGQWTLFRNVTLPNRKADLDAVLAGPAGIWLLEIKTYRGTYRVSGDKWDVSRGGHWQGAPSNPSVQAKRNAARLSEFLKEQGSTFWINPVVVWANPEAPLLLDNPQTSVWVMDTLRDELGNLAFERAIKPDELQRAVSALTNLCEAAAKEREAEMES